MISVYQGDQINVNELLIVRQRLRELGVTVASIRPGNGCVWVSRGLVEEYYIFRQGRLVDIQVD
jgi:hypothetical protein